MQPIRFATLQVPPRDAVAEPPAAPKEGFAGRIRDALANANRELQQVEHTASQFASGEIDTVETVLALTKADLTLRHVVALRNRILESVQEVMRIPL